MSDGLKNFLSGGFGGICTVLSGHPFDLVKVTMQSQTQLTTGPSATGGGPVIHKSSIDCVKYIVRKDGFFGLYRGVSAPLTGIVPIFATCFWGYDIGCKGMYYLTGKHKIGNTLHNVDNGEKTTITRNRITNTSNNYDASKLTIFDCIMAGGFSAIPTTLLMAPGERIKCLLQIQSEKYNKGMLDCAKRVIQDGGLRNLFVGWEATLLRDVPGSMAYFGIYELLKRSFVAQQMKLEASLLAKSADKDSLSSSPPPPPKLPTLAILFAGGMAGIANWVVAIPADTVKSRLQSSNPGTYRGLYHAYETIVAEGGHRALFRGIGPAMSRAFPANASCFLGVEVMKNLLTQLGM